jgi:site-specific DNA recombinase
VRCEPVLSPTEWRRLQERLDNNPTGRMPAEAAPLVRVAQCLLCAGSMYRLVCKAKDAKGQPVQYVYYRCKGTETEPSRCRNSIREDVLTEALGVALMRDYGELEMTARELVPGNGVAARLAIVTESLSELEADRYERGLFSGPEGTARFARLYGGLEAQLADLRGQEAVEEYWKPVPLGYTVAKRWAELEPSEHGSFLRSLGIRAYVLAKMPADGLSGLTPGLGFKLASLNGVAPVGTPVVMLVTPNADEVRRAITAL